MAEGKVNWENHTQPCPPLTQPMFCTGARINPTYKIDTSGVGCVLTDSGERVGGVSGILLRCDAASERVAAETSG